MPADYSTIQAAVDHCSDYYDTVLISPGTYTGPGNRDITISKTVVIQGKGTPDDVVLDAAGISSDPHCIFVINGLERHTVSLRQLTIQNGYNDREESYGAGVFSKDANLEIRWCRIANNKHLYYNIG